MQVRRIAAIVGLSLGLAMTACGGTTDTGSTTSQSGASGNAITIKNFAFSPSPLSVKAGTAVTVTNSDTATHTFTSDSGAPISFDSSNLASGQSFTVSLPTAGTYSFHCNIHQTMKGTITVT